MMLRAAQHLLSAAQQSSLSRGRGFVRKASDSHRIERFADAGIGRASGIGQEAKPMKITKQMDRSAKRLRLERETLRRLNDAQLQRIVAAGLTGANCAPSGTVSSCP